MNVTLVAEIDPNFTVAPETKLVPVRVTVVPPDQADVGDIDENVGAGLIADSAAAEVRMKSPVSTIPVGTLIITEALTLTFERGRR